MQNTVSVPRLLDEYRERSTPYFDSFFQKKIQEAEDIDNVTGDLLKYLHKLSAIGKKVRGFLVVLGYELAGGKDLQAIYDASIFIEIAHAGLLVHDDIMDEDRLRRGQTTIHAFYENLGTKLKAKPSPKRYGESMGICAGDIAFYLSWEKLLTSSFPQEAILAASRLYAEAFSRVAYGQVLDISASIKTLSEKEILNILLLKTAEYSGSLPLIIGATLAGSTDKHLLKNLKSFGLCLGWVFQIQDDILGVFGDEKVTGKPVGSDIREGKQTLLVSYFLSHAKMVERGQFLQLYGKLDISQKEIKYVQNLFSQTGSYEYVNNVAEKYTSKGLVLVPKLTTSAQLLSILRELLLYIHNRTK